MEIMQFIPQTPSPAIPDAGLLVSDKAGNVPRRTPPVSSAFAALFREMAAPSPPGVATAEVVGKSGLPAAAQDEAPVAAKPEKKEAETEESPSSAANESPLPMMLVANGIPTQMQSRNVAAQAEPVGTMAVSEGAGPGATVAQHGVLVKADEEMLSAVLSAAKPASLTPQPAMATRDASSANLQQQSNHVPAAAQPLVVAPPQVGDNQGLPDTVHSPAKPDVAPAILSKGGNAPPGAGESLAGDAKLQDLSGNRPPLPETVQVVASLAETTSPQQVNVDAAGQTPPSQTTVTATPAQPTVAPALQDMGGDAGKVQMPAITASSVTKEPEANQQQLAIQSRPATVTTAKSAQEKGVHQVRNDLQGAAELPEAKKADSTATAPDPAKVEIVFQEPSSRKEFSEGENKGGSGMNEKMPGTLHNGAVTDAPKNFAVPEPQPKTEAARSALSESIMTQVKEGLAAHDAKGQNHITISLKPAELGELKINVSMVDHRLKVEVVAENRMVKDVLMGNLDTLKENLSRQNLTMDRFDVQTGVGHGFNQSFGDEKWAPLNQSYKNFTSMTGPVDEGEEQGAGYLTAATNSLVDVRF